MTIIYLKNKDFVFTVTFDTFKSSLLKKKRSKIVLLTPKF